MKMKNRIPPGQHLTERFPTLHYGQIPVFNPSNWDFRIWGEVEEPIVWNWEEVMALPRVRFKMDLHCVTTWSKLDMLWEGISLRQLVVQGLVKPTPNAQFVLQHADLGYTANLPLEVMLQDNFLLATHYAGEPLTPEHGFPLRGVTGAIPGRDDLKDVYLWKGAKWLRGLEFLSADQLGFWEANGYSNEADVWKEQRFSR